MSNRRKFSLKWKTVLITAIGFALCVSVYYGIIEAGNVYIEYIYLSDRNVKNREAQYAEQFQKYVAQNNIASNETQKIKKWCKEQEFVFLDLYKNGYLYYETNGDYESIYTPPQAQDEECYETLYSVTFRDDVYSISVFECSEEWYYNTFMIAGIVAGMIALILTVMQFSGRVITRVIRLSNAVKVVRDGSLKKEIIPSGCDELAQLCGDVNDMRLSIIRHYESEQEAWKANNELLTSISHDIRTPLTALIGYAEVLADSSRESSEAMQQYAAVCLEKAYQLKELTDALFRYFVVFGNPEIQTDMLSYPAPILLQQLLGEHQAYLSQIGFAVELKPLVLTGIVRTDIALLRRVFDNLFSNVEKYADRDAAVTISAEENESGLCVTIENRIAFRANRAESTMIGLKTCEKIMNRLNGTFRYSSANDVFCAVITIPASNE